MATFSPANPPTDWSPPAWTTRPIGRRRSHHCGSPGPPTRWTCVGEGANTLAQALLRVDETRKPGQVKAFVEELRVYSISDRGRRAPDHPAAYRDVSYPVLYPEAESWKAQALRSRTAKEIECLRVRAGSVDVGDGSVTAAEALNMRRKGRPRYPSRRTQASRLTHSQASGNRSLRQGSRWEARIHTCRYRPCDAVTMPRAPRPAPLAVPEPSEAPPQWFPATSSRSSANSRVNPDVEVQTTQGRAGKQGKCVGDAHAVIDLESVGGVRVRAHIAVHKAVGEGWGGGEGEQNSADRKQDKRTKPA